MLVNIKKIIAKILNTPLVIEEGTDSTSQSGITWTYRKWTDGRAECWGKWSGTLSHYGTAFGGYAYNTSLAFPTNLFNSSPIVQYSATVGSSFAVTGTLIESVISATNCTYYFISGASGSQACCVYPYAVGAWMELDPDSQTMIAPIFSQEQMSKASIRALIEGSGHIYRENSNWTPSDLL